jgi:hypothetical protein
MATPKFTEAAVQKAVAGAIKGGLKIGRVEIDPKSGRIMIHAQGGEPQREDDDYTWEDWIRDHADDKPEPRRWARKTKQP